MRYSGLITLAASLGISQAQYKGFNYGSTASSGAAYTQQEYTNLFNTASGLTGTSGFTSARLYTMIQAGTTSDITSAIPAAQGTGTKLLLGLWASGGDAGFQNELNALTAAITQYPSLASQIVGISVGSEDLYRISPQAVQAGSTNPGAEPNTLVGYIGRVNSAIANTAWSSVPVGHVDTWTAFANTSNDAVAAACSFVGVDAYPYFQTVDANTIDNGASLFQTALNSLTATAKSKSIWITETGWPVSGPTSNQAVPGTAQAKQYWDAVGCDLLFGKYNTWWYTLQDAGSSPSFGVVGSSLSTTPLFDLSCSGSSSSSSSSASSSTTTSAQKSAATSITSAATSGATSGASSSAASSANGGSPSSVASPSSFSGSAYTVTGSAAAGDVTETVYTTTLITVTACASASSNGAPASYDTTVTEFNTVVVTATSCSSGVCSSAPASSAPTSSAPASSAKSSSAPVSSYSTSSTPVASSYTKPSTTVASSSIATSKTVASTTTSASVSPSASACPADINGEYQYPHLIVPISSSSPNTAYGTSYNGTINSTVSTIFNFDIPSSYAGKRCSLIFLFPKLSQLETSSYSFNGQGGLVSHVLSSNAVAGTTYANAPAAALQNGAIPSLSTGNSYVISSDACPANTRVSFELTATGGLDLEFFEDYNPSPLGLYVRAC
ncbi:glycoside hydrolase family 17 protein [Myriangium duriaei CBS 260.36]|uniref:glucan endo-1,3-beta-D-glucosidase n=1 Tax=Myriangium duriaei CBS 260.36 TaxID=1168546 RepID=A0A9P4IYE3_9PEZI|nr:glycoside hydrolase family 17 protein [Myriangium duriaei CBS 260.36]